MRVCAQRGRFGAYITEEEMRKLYELKYKYQMLLMETKFGDHGIPKVLPDKAYYEFAQLQSDLEVHLDSLHETMTNVYDEWIEGHEPSDEDVISNEYESAMENEHEFIRYDAKTLKDLAERYGEEEILGTVKQFMDDNELYSDFPDYFEEKMNYLYPETHPLQQTAQEEIQEEMKFMKDPSMVWTEGPKKHTFPLEVATTLAEFEPVYELYNEEIDKLITNEGYFSTAAKEGIDIDEARSRYEEDTALGGVREMRQQLDDGWNEADLGGKIILFQEALTTVHNNGEMAEYLLQDTNAVQLLSDLSNDAGVEYWNKDLKKMLGYPPMSYAQPVQEWFVPAKLLAGIKRLAAILRMIREYQ